MSKEFDPKQLPCSMLDAINPDFADVTALQSALQTHGIWCDQWHSGLVQKLSEDVRSGERTFEVDATGRFVTRLRVVSGGLTYHTPSQGEGIVRAKKRVLFFDSNNKEIPGRTQEFYEKDDRIIGGKIRNTDSAIESYLREIQEELPSELLAFLNPDEVIIAEPRVIEGISPGYPNLYTLNEVNYVKARLYLPDNIDLTQVFPHKEEKKLPNGETKIVFIQYEFTPAVS